MIHINTQRWPYLEWRREEISGTSIGWTALGVSVIAGGTTNAFAKVLGTWLSPISLLFLSEALMCAFVLFSFGLMPTLRKLIRLPKAWFAPMILVGLLNSTLAPMLLFQGLQRSTAINVSLFSNSEMVFLILLAITILGERFTRTHLLSVCAMIGGMLTIALRGFTDGIELQAGDLIIILSGFTYACGSMVYRKFLHHCEPQLLLFMRSMTAILCFLFLSLFLEHSLVTEVGSFPMKGVTVLLGFGFLSRFLNVFGFYEALERLPVTTVSLVSNGTMIFSIIFSHWFLGETIYGYHYIGGALIILGALLLEFAGTHPSEAHLEAHLQQRSGHRA